MKRLTAILFLAIMLFNLFGYKLLIHFLLNRNDTQLAVLINNHEFNDEELITIKTPLSLPYYSNSEAYERVEGVISIDGKHYNYVKRRVFNDSLELLCLPNTEKTKLVKLEIDILKTVSDNNSNEGHNKKQVVVKNMQLELYQNSLLDIPPPEVNLTAVVYSSFNYYLPTINSKVQTPPPNVMQDLT